MQVQEDEVARALAVLGSPLQAIRAHEWPNRTTTRDLPGLYSWWADDHGAADLSQGLGVRIAPGLIYAGQAGATSWPSGKQYAQTLHGRIGKNHLGGAIRRSTLRRTLASCLVRVLGLEPVAAIKPALTSASEVRLTQWMKAHLRVVLYHVENRGTLGDLEHRVLLALNPPLNLDGMDRTAVRQLLGRARLQLNFAASDIDPPAMGMMTVEPRKRIRRSTTVTLHDEIAVILEMHSNNWMTTQEISHMVNERGIYKKRDGTPVSAFQIHGRTRNYNGLFEREGSRVRLISREIDQSN
jgi:hypothetical protein